MLPLHEVFKSNLRILLEIKSLSQTDLANKMGVTRGNVSKLLNSDTSPNLNTVEQIASALDVPPHFLFKTLPLADADLDLLENIEEALDKMIEAKGITRTLLSE